MDITVHRVIAALKDEQKKFLEALGEYPKKDAFEHGVAVGNYHGTKHCLDVIEGILLDDDRREAEL